MAVTKTAYTGWITLSGTMAEVIASLSVNNVPFSKVQILYNGTNISAVYHL